jgi:hypothetical protein
MGDRQHQILVQLVGRGWTPLWELADDPDDPNEMAKARSAVRGLERRGFVRTMRDADPDRLVSTTVIIGEVGSLAGGVDYVPMPSSRAWYGTWVVLADRA